MIKKGSFYLNYCDINNLYGWTMFQKLPLCISKWVEEVDKLLANLRDKKEYAIHIRNLKQALNHGLVLKQAHRVIKFNQ